MLSSRVLRRQYLRKWKRRKEINRLRHLFMASVAYNFRAALYEWVLKDILKVERNILHGKYGTHWGSSIPRGIINYHKTGGEDEKDGSVGSN